MAKVTKTKGKIGLEEGTDAWVCLCENVADGSGFHPCDKGGNEMAPDEGGDWDGLYVCAGCGRIIQEKNLKVVGRNPDPIFLM